MSFPLSFTEASRGPHTVRQTREAAQRVPPPLPSASPSDQMAGQSLQHQCPSTSRHAEHPYTTHPKTPTVARSCSPYGTRSLTKAIPLRELWEGTRRVGWPLLRFKDVCKRDLRLAELNPNTWEVLAQDRAAWRHDVKEGAISTSISSWGHQPHLYQLQHRLPFKNRAFESLKSLSTLMRWPSTLRDEDATTTTTTWNFAVYLRLEMEHSFPFFRKAAVYRLIKSESF